ncbi:hypothetical protein EG68_07575 [Paragonimus skrjabini miyazakii]|uniref:G-protein coupled receptors family 1 profile domain-containing protein n=1 Tax=Paragonimus skrjabini miyazakii TaxID=59628 RepID=A0A8S9YQP0_9TREM|nr:hypothetical protein EG68_07575 [Paragonimus skrjabini miyazakii]
MLLGIGLNVAMFIELRTVNLQSRLTPWLLRSQVVFDGLACCLTILILWVQEIPTYDEVSGAIVCYLWDCQSPFWAATALNTCNLMCIAFDHLLATVYCVTYRIYQTRYIVGCCIATFIYTLLVALPVSLVVYYTNGTCHVEVRPEHIVAFHTAKIHQRLWAVVYYLLPLIFLITVNFRVVWHIKSCFCLRYTFNEPITKLSLEGAHECNFSLVIYYANGTCQVEVRPEHIVAYNIAKIHQALWAVVYYLLPLVFLITVHFRVVWHIKAYFRLRHTSTEPITKLSLEGAHECNCESVSKECDAHSRSVVKSLTIGTFCLIASMILAHSYDSFYYVFGPLLGYAYIVGSGEQLISLLITALNCVANPVILALSLPSLRKKLFRHMRMIKEYLGEVCHSCPSVPMKPSVH